MERRLLNFAPHNFFLLLRLVIPMAVTCHPGLYLYFALVIYFLDPGIAMSSHSNSENAPPRTEKSAWGYEAGNGPDVWGRLSPGFILCAEGAHQSPIDLANPTEAKLPAVVFNYRPTALDIRNNGHTNEVASSSENWIEVGGARYELLQFHFHAPGEHTVAGRSFDMGDAPGSPGRERHTRGHRSADRAGRRKHLIRSSLGALARGRWSSPTFTGTWPSTPKICCRPPGTPTATTAL